ncbi:MAG: hypothetical protein IPJ87_16250 [Flavobacteriales bacterium]|jgi:hypothetical protein|nr:hypothetical protein [Flavobacteriales bacterium]MBK7943399.1 hypothetical protein [Flavobacteriales bacterium]MBK8948049.1 hypothetical protein [Flavobacteriales bacterium]MBK9699911.1 hypothetical protein [Flavobacteriales bacterium]
MRNAVLALRIVLPAITAVLCVPSSAQYFRTTDYWKTHRNEITIGLGASNFLGELGGRDQIGSSFIWDLEVSQTRPGFSLGWRYYLRERLSLRTQLAYGVLAGNDNLTEEPARKRRNLSFRSDVYELALMLEIHPFLEELGHLYDIRGVKGSKSSRIGLYGFVGVGGFYFNPKTKFNNAWVDLKPLRTEGQGMEGGPEEYSNFSLCIPMGIGIRKQLSKVLSVGLEMQYTKTFTDYIDDVSGNYYDNDLIAEANGGIGSESGELAAFLADPQPEAVRYSEGEQRGDPDDLDAYLFLRAQVHYKLYKYKTRSKKYRTRLRRQKIVF